MVSNISMSVPPPPPPTPPLILPPLCFPLPLLSILASFLPLPKPSWLSPSPCSFPHFSILSVVPPPIRNIRGLCSNLTDLSIQATVDKLDICLTDSLLQRGIPDSFVSLPGYCILWFDRSEPRPSGGVALHIKNSISHHVLLSHLSNPRSTSACNFLSVPTSCLSVCCTILPIVTTLCLSVSLSVCLSVCLSKAPTKPLSLNTSTSILPPPFQISPLTPPSQSCPPSHRQSCLLPTTSLFKLIPPPPSFSHFSLPSLLLPTAIHSFTTQPFVLLPIRSSPQALPQCVINCQQLSRPPLLLPCPTLPLLSPAPKASPLPLPEQCGPQTSGAFART
uniref:Uncharacterized protein n=1 Tax=Eptatretus burgeri TaxID=7764 RepID=A0A8C4N1P0_EPTBU